uniref:Secreted protein n=1 Tax=Steinernema glaseri TaxID=37863 RepID=A0A1I7Z657_9BILA
MPSFTFFPTVTKCLLHLMSRRSLVLLKAYIRDRLPSSPAPRLQATWQPRRCDLVAVTVATSFADRSYSVTIRPHSVHSALDRFH